jgi:hypothetical protein
LPKIKSHLVESDFPKFNIRTIDNFMQIINAGQTNSKRFFGHLEGILLTSWTGLLGNNHLIVAECGFLGGSKG